MSSTKSFFPSLGSFKTLILYSLIRRSILARYSSLNNKYRHIQFNDLHSVYWSIDILDQYSHIVYQFNIFQNDLYLSRLVTTVHVLLYGQNYKIIRTYKLASCFFNVIKRSFLNTSDRLSYACDKPEEWKLNISILWLRVYLISQGSTIEVSHLYEMWIMQAAMHM